MALVVTLCYRLLQLWVEHVDAVSPARRKNLPRATSLAPNHLTPLATLPLPLSPAGHDVLIGAADLLTACATGDPSRVMYVLGDKWFGMDRVPANFLMLSPTSTLRLLRGLFAILVSISCSCEYADNIM